MIQGWFNTWNMINLVNHNGRLQDKNHTIILIDIEEAFEKIQYSFMIKGPRVCSTKGNIPEHNKTYKWEIQSQHHLPWGKL